MIATERNHNHNEAKNNLDLAAVTKLSNQFYSSLSRHILLSPQLSSKDSHGTHRINLISRSDLKENHLALGIISRASDWMRFAWRPLLR